MPGKTPFVLNLESRGPSAFVRCCDILGISVEGFPIISLGTFVAYLNGALPCKQLTTKCRVEKSYEVLHAKHRDTASWTIR
ncbi:unnamed protein product [Cyclocybe aegerita]|uniref:Uncharacterized protein n=1 Tax=Cyclocybe aegerita TaxID=1973307 RepID=A0A8S0WCT3_CYCAE|nr:unnamed protein product [Cyclocybe aegerita]